MSEPVDVLVIGGGVVGACSAYYLAERGRQVTLVEQGEIAAGSSYGNAGFVVPSHSIPLAHPGVLAEGLRWMLDPESPFYIRPRFDLDLLAWLWHFRAASNDRHVRRSIPLLYRLQCASLELYEALAALEDFEFGFTHKGLLLLYRSREAYKDGLEEAHVLSKFGIASRALDGEGVRALEPTVRPEVVGGVHFPSDAHLDPAGFVRGLARLAEQRGVCLRTHTEVLGFETSGRKIRIVKTTRGDFRPAEVVLAAGAWSSAIARDLRLRLPIQPAKGYSITVRRPETCPSLPMLLSESRVAITPLGEFMRLAGTLELAGLDLSINRRRVDAILRGARDYLSGFDSSEVVEIWRGLRPCTPDGLPFLGRSESFENLIVAAGHAMIGQSLGPITGRLVAELACGDTPSIDLTALRPNRYHRRE